jgi:phosphate transport system permease protein
MSATSVPQAPPAVATASSSGLQHRRPLPRWTPTAVFTAAAVVAVLLGLVTALSPVTFVLYTAVLGTLGLWAAARRVEGARAAKDRLVTCLVIGAFALTLVPLLSLLYEVVRRGLARLDGTFFNSSLVGIIGEGGGAYHAIFGTLIITGLTIVISVPVGLLTAIYLVEYGTGRLKKAITFLVDVMTGIPSIVAGLFAYALFAIFFGPGVRMGLAGAVALSVLMIPVVVRSAEEVLKLVPNELREAAYALGVRKWRTILKVVIPTAISGIASGVTLAIARVIGETAPILVTAGFATSINNNVFGGWMASLPTFIYTQILNPTSPANPDPSSQRAWGAALVLIILVMILNLGARLIARVFAPKTGR